MAKTPRNLRNPWLVNELCAYKALCNCRETFTDVMIALQIGPFCTNKPNFRKSQMNLTNVLTKDYENKDTWWSGKNKPNSNPIQSQSNPIKANLKQKQTQFKPKTNPIPSPPKLRPYNVPFSLNVPIIHVSSRIYVNIFLLDFFTSYRYLSFSKFCSKNAD